MKRASKTAAGLVWLAALGACASIVATQTFELSTESVAMPLPFPDVALSQPQTITLTTSFGSCSKTSLGSLESLRANSHVDALDVWVIVRDVELRSDASFSGIQNLALQLVTAEDTISVCDRTLSAAEQAASTISCPFEHRVRAEDLCGMLTGSAPAQMTIELTVRTGDVTLSKVGAKLTVETELDADVSL